MGENESTTTGAKRRRWLRWPILESLAVAVVVAVVAWLWPTTDPPPLNEEEQRFVGRWFWQTVGKISRKETTGECRVQSDKMMTITWNDTPARNEYLAVANWRIMGGYLSLTDRTLRHESWSEWFKKRFSRDVPTVECSMVWDGEDRVVLDPWKSGPLVEQQIVLSRIRDGAVPMHRRRR